MNRAIVSSRHLLRALRVTTDNAPVWLQQVSGERGISVAGMPIGGEAEKFTDFMLSQDKADRLACILAQLHEQPITLICDIHSGELTMQQLSI